MRRLMILLLLFVLPVMACSLIGQTSAPTSEVPTQTQVIVPTATDMPANGQALDGPDINFNGIRFTLDPALGSRIYVFDDVTSLDGKTAYNIRFALNPEEYCQTWCLMIYHVADFEQAFGTFVFPPNGYRGGAAVVFETQKKTLSMQNGSGDRSLETFGQNNYAVSNNALKYVFRGYSSDKQYGIYVQIPVRTSSLPGVAPTMSANSQEILDYNQKTAESLSALSSADFTPNLDVLDALVASIHIKP